MKIHMIERQWVKHKTIEVSCPTGCARKKLLIAYSLEGHQLSLIVLYNVGHHLLVRRYMAGIMPIQRKTQNNQSVSYW